ncbi:rCG27687, isoform CRA_e [Rattus norvegicus]|uniref:RCG27687, isoform CRA_e n=1 Tax=Rattus norvegicus TaxID=10116 RepID=A6KBY8_RAT|nr:rCG27687, isoform CRA_e [Rattus norvegicus]EDL97399.1 rCG27687, isoform CRA_e [Rattus norvegicus]
MSLITLQGGCPMISLCPHSPASIIYALLAGDGHELAHSIPGVTAPQQGALCWFPHYSLLTLTWFTAMEICCQ